VLSTNAPSGELQPVVRHVPPFCPRTSKKFALIAIVGSPIRCHACSGA
jgi:hypothetical protein